MNNISAETTLVASIASIILCIYTYHKDRTEKEPLSLLAALFCVSGILSIPSVYIENILQRVIGDVFSDYFQIDITGIMKFTSSASAVSYNLIVSFLVVALIETAVKWAVLFLITHKNKNFNSLFDGLIYGVFVSLGFAVFDNIRFAWMNGWDMLLIRTATTTPIHMVVGVLMGVFYTLWHIFSLAAKAEKKLEEDGKITVTKPFAYAPFLALSAATPFLTRGLFRFAEYSQTDGSKAVFYIFIFILFVIGFVCIHKASDADSLDNEVVSSLIRKKYKNQLNGN